MLMYLQCFFVFAFIYDACSAQPPASGECQDTPLGVANRRIIEDNRFTASSYYSYNGAPHTARLHGTYGWRPKRRDDPNEYLQIDLGALFIICAVATQGHSWFYGWTTEYKISTSIDNTAWTTYQSGVKPKFFQGNTDRYTVVKNTLDTPTQARFIRFIPTKYYRRKGLRVEVYGSKKDVAENIKENWTVQRLNNYAFSSVACDQTIEQTLNRDSKMKGGMVGITLNKGAVHRWIMGQAERSAIAKQCEAMANVFDVPRKRKDLDKTRCAADEKAVKDVIQTVKEMVNPFDNDHQVLVHLSSGLVATASVQSDMKNMFERGEKAAVEYMQSNILSPNPDIYTPIKKTKLQTFSSMSKKVNTKSKRGEIVALKNSKMLFAKMVLIARSRDLEMKDVLKYSLRPFPLPLATCDGNLVKTIKAKLLNFIEAEVSNAHVERVVGESVLIIDAMAIMQTLTALPSTFGELANDLLVKIVNMALYSKSSRVDFVCDRYPTQSIKNLEREKRGEDSALVVQIYGNQQRVPRQWKKFMSSGKNKEELMKFIFHGSLIINAELFFETGVQNKRRIISLTRVKQHLGHQWCSALIGFHAFTGCDTVSAFYGEGKVFALKVARKKEEYAQYFSRLGTFTEPSNDLNSHLSSFVCDLYGFENSSDINFARYMLFKGGKYGEEFLPTNEDTLNQHTRRANYQCYIWRHATERMLNIPDFTQHGWNVNDDGSVSIKWMTLAPAPDSVLEFINCKCSKGCENNRCSCRKNILKCTELCKCIDCKNCDSDEAEERMEDDSDIDEYQSLDGESSCSDNEDEC